MRILCFIIAIIICPTIIAIGIVSLATANDPLSCAFGVVLIACGALASVRALREILPKDPYAEEDSEEDPGAAGRERVMRLREQHVASELVVTFSRVAAPSNHCACPVCGEVFPIARTELGRCPTCWVAGYLEEQKEGNSYGKT